MAVFTFSMEMERMSLAQLLLPFLLFPHTILAQESAADVLLPTPSTLYIRRPPPPAPTIPSSTRRQQQQSGFPPWIAPIDRPVPTLRPVSAPPTQEPSVQPTTMDPTTLSPTTGPTVQPTIREEPTVTDAAAENDDTPTWATPSVPSVTTNTTEPPAATGPTTATTTTNSTTEPTTTTTPQPSVAPTTNPTMPPTRSPTMAPTTATTESPTTASPTTSNSNNNDDNINNNSNSLAKVAVYYYPWWGKDFHRGGPYTRGELAPPQLPALGEYDDTDPAVIAQHLQWSRQANIDVWIGAWWGPNKREDTTMLNVILPHGDLGTLELALLYETRNRIPLLEGNNGMYSLENVYSDVQHIAKHYFSHSNYLRIDGRPVLFIYVTRWLDRHGLLGPVTTLMRNAAWDMGYNVYLVGDQVWRDAPSDPNHYEPFQYLDGVTNYDVYGNLKTPEDPFARRAGVELYHARQKAWKEACQSLFLYSQDQRCSFFPSAMPGFNNKGSKTPMSRRLDETAESGSLFRVMLDHAVTLVDDAADRILIVTSFNEWHEDTQIEPVAAVNVTTNQPKDITLGVQHEAYGEMYLDMLREATTRKG